MSFYHSTAGLMGLFVTYGSFTVMAASSMRGYNPLDPLDTEVTRAFEDVVTPIREHVISLWQDEQASWREKRALAGVYSPEDLKGDIRELKDRIDQRDQRCASLDKDRETLGAELRILREANESMGKRLEDTLQVLDTIRADYEVLQLDREYQTLRIAELEGHNAALKHENDYLRQQAHK